MKHLYKITSRHGIDLVAADDAREALSCWAQSRDQGCDPAADTAQCEQVPDEAPDLYAYHVGACAELQRQDAASPAPPPSSPAERAFYAARSPVYEQPVGRSFRDSNSAIGG